jgi:dTDP-4-amino-4,6-dideoxy-D-galactose acyltransferase
MICYLKWDSEFFEKKIGKLEDNILDSLDTLSQEDISYDLIYIFSDKELNLLIKPIDIKVTYAKKTQKRYVNENVKEYQNLLYNYDDLVALAYVSGHDSRFLKDPFFGEIAFKKLYKRWIDNAISDTNTTVFVYIENNQLLGFVTCTQHEEYAVIGLIAVAATAQGKGIGGKLIEAVENKLEVDTLLYVSTQKTNSQACDFYERKGFTVNSIKYIYHYAPNTI